MAHAFAPISAKPAFGTLKENLYQSDYLNRKKAKYAYCRTPSYCNKIKDLIIFTKEYIHNKNVLDLRYSKHYIKQIV